MATAVAPWQQGALDSLCGAYAVINAVHHAAPDPGLSLYECCDLFRELTASLDAQFGMGRLVADGLTRRPVGQALHVAVKWAYETRGWHLDVRWPFYRSARTPLKVVLDQMRCHLSQPNTAVITAFAGALEHWTVVSGVERNRICLFDSTRRRFLLRRNLGDWSNSDKRYQLWATFTAFVSISGR